MPADWCHQPGATQEDPKAGGTRWTGGLHDGRSESKHLDNVFSDVWSGEGVSYLFVRLQNYIHISFTFVQLRCLFKDEMDFGLGFWVGIGVPYFIAAGVNYRVFMKLQVKAKMRLMASEGADFQGK